MNEDITETDTQYSYPYSINTGIPRQNGDGFEQYARRQVYLSSLSINNYSL